MIYIMCMTRRMLFNLIILDPLLSSDSAKGHTIAHFDDMFFNDTALLKVGEQIIILLYSYLLPNMK